jgi:hypothetical protein
VCCVRCVCECVQHATPTYTRTHACSTKTRCRAGSLPSHQHKFLFPLFSFSVSLRSLLLYLLPCLLPISSLLLLLLPLPLPLLLLLLLPLLLRSLILSLITHLPQSVTHSFASAFTGIDLIVQSHLIVSTYCQVTCASCVF